MKVAHIIGLVVIAVSIGVIVAMVGDFSSYETFATAKAMPGSQLHIVGKLDTIAPLEYDAQKNANYFAFYMNDKSGEKCKVVFNGTKPQDFERSEQIVLTGSMNGKEFQASNILLKCPSKYTNREEEISEFSAKKS
jgi:cytochrome c-type biogenesis protein CcmE